MVMDCPDCARIGIGTRVPALKRNPAETRLKSARVWFAGAAG
jgi:hypothetical protein